MENKMRDKEQEHNKNLYPHVDIEGECLISNKSIHFITNIRKSEYSKFCHMDMVIYDKENRQYIRLQNADILRIIKDNYEEV
jgi:hypothetical protein